MSDSKQFESALEPSIAEEREVLATSREELGKRRLELAAFQERLDRFQTKYYEIVYPLYSELDDVKYEINEIKGVDEFGDTLDSDDEFAGSSKTDGPEGAVDSLSDARRTKPTQELKDLFKRSAKLVHPDLANEEVERGLRTQYMSQINEAYRVGDVDQLQNAVDEFFESVPGAIDEPPDVELSRVRRMVAQCRRDIFNVECETYQLQISHLGEHLERAEEAAKQGWDYLAALAQELKSDLAEAVAEYELLSGEAYTRE